MVLFRGAVRKNILTIWVKMIMFLLDFKMII